MKARSLALLALLSSLMLAGCLAPGPQPAATPTARATATPAVAQAQAYDVLDQELAAIPDLNASEVEQLLAK